MKKPISNKKKKAAFSLPELVVTMACGAIVMAALTVLISTGAMLFAKNVSTNTSHISMRTALDQVSMSFNNAAGQPTLVAPNGTVVASGAAAGIRFDQNLGGPYVVTHPGGTGLLATATSLTLVRSMNPLATPPLPVTGDIIILDGGQNVRLRVSSVSVGATDASSRQTITVTISPAAGTAIPWDASTTKIARLYRNVAFVVVPVGTKNQLRLFRNAETVTNFTTATNFATICDNIGVNAADKTPFSLSTATDLNNRKYLDMGLRIRAREYDVRLARQEKTSFSSVMRLNVSLAPKGP